jgi:hypothetical protein
MRHITRLAFYQILFEGGFDVFNLAAFNQKAGKMRAADHVLISGECQRTGQTISNARPQQVCGHCLCTPHTPGAHRRQPLLQFGIIRIKIQAHHMNGQPIP